MSKQGKIPVEQAMELLLENTPAPERCETLPLLDALGRVSAAELRAAVSQPPFDRSPLDGYAVLHSDLAGACAERPAVLRVTQAIYAGDTPKGPVRPGECARIMTGAPLPPGATCVVRQEDTDGDARQVSIYVSHNAHDNYCFASEDIRVGSLLLKQGERLDSVRIGLLAGQGLDVVRVFRKPRIRVISTGSELAAAGTALPPGQIYESNRFTLSARAVEVGARALPGVIVADDPALIARTVAESLEECDLVVTSGGVSVGAHDFMPQAGEMLGAKLLFRGVAAKPGSPVIGYKKDGKLLLCLSGNPFASFAMFELLAVPVLRKLAGDETVYPVRIKGTLMDCFDKASPGRRFLRARIERGRVYLPEGHASGVLSTLVGCNCLVDIPAGTPGLEQGRDVDVVML